MEKEKQIKPMLFSAPMVQAILKGTKMQTRREMVSSSPEMTASMMNVLCGVDDPQDLIKYSHISVGNVLWVRETWKIGSWKHEDDVMAFDYKASPELIKTPFIEFQDSDRFSNMTERAIEELDRLGIEPDVDEENETFSYKWELGQSPFKWKPSIHMPKEAARIFLKVTDVRIQCLHDISEGDAEAEGIERMPLEHWWRNYLNDPLPGCSMAKESFKTLWKFINGFDSWARNPLVWVITFEVCEKPEDFLTCSN